MANTRAKNHEKMAAQILGAATRMFLQHGYDETTIKAIAAEAHISVGSLLNIFGTKEDILCALVQNVFQKQFQVADGLLRDKTGDKVLLYAAETCLQLHMAEASESIRSLYVAAYSLPKTTQIIRMAITEKLEVIFAEYMPGLLTRDFYMLEIASGGIMRGYMATPCDMWFTMERKMDAFLAASLRIYRVPEEKIQEAKSFVAQFDFASVAKGTIESILRTVQGK